MSSPAVSAALAVPVEPFCPPVGPRLRAARALGALAALALVAALASPARSAAQAAPASTVADSVDGPYARARRLVSDGDGPAGRALVDSLLAVATPGTAAYAEALYWRATLAESGADAERDYRLLAVEYQYSPRAVDALVRLAQLNLARGSTEEARAHLVRLLREHPEAASRARAHYWLARVALEGRDATAACAALNASAAAAQPGSDVARQVAGLKARVPGCTLQVAVGSGTPGGPPRTTDNTVAPSAPNPTDAPRTTPTPAEVPSVTAARPAAPGFTIQVAAYDQRRDAEAAAARLRGRGVDARVSNDAAPFRVRVGRYATRAEAATALRDLRQRGVAGFVTDAEAVAEARP